MDEDVFARIRTATDPDELQHQLSALRFSYPVAKLQAAVESHLRLRKLRLLLED